MLWNTPPDWLTPVIERLEWKTNVLLAYDGTEQRVALRQTPRRSIEFNFLIIDAKARRTFESQLYNNGSQSWDLPIWTDATPSTAAISNGDTVIYVPLGTIYRDFHEGGQAVLLSGTQSQIVTISTVGSTQLNLSAPVIGNWSAETAVIPVRPAHLDLSQTVTRFTGDSVYGTARFLMDDVSESTVVGMATNYRDMPVFTQVPNWTQDPSTQYERKMQVVDFNGAIYYDDESNLPEFKQTHTWALDGINAISSIRGLLYSLRGRLTAFWMPSFMPDVVLKANVGASALQMDVSFGGFTDYYNEGRNRRDIYIELHNGTILCRRITASSVVDADTEQLTIDSALGMPITPDDVTRISLMFLGRLEADAVELAWHWGDYAEATAAVRSINNDL